jgi:hypothetical protein
MGAWKLKICYSWLVFQHFVTKIDWKFQGIQDTRTSDIATHLQRSDTVKFRESSSKRWVIGKIIIFFFNKIVGIFVSMKFDIIFFLKSPFLIEVLIWNFSQKISCITPSIAFLIHLISVSCFKKWYHSSLNHFNGIILLVSDK